MNKTEILRQIEMEDDSLADDQFIEVEESGRLLDVTHILADDVEIAKK